MEDLLLVISLGVTFVVMMVAIDFSMKKNRTWSSFVDSLKEMFTHLIRLTILFMCFSIVYFVVFYIFKLIFA
jgi:hypothetical protein